MSDSILVNLYSKGNVIINGEIQIFFHKFQTRKSTLNQFQNMFIHENVTHSSTPTSWKTVHCFQFFLTLVLSTQFFPTALTPVLSSLYDYYMIDKHNKLLSVLVRVLWNLKMLYIISLLVIYDTMISLTYFLMLFLICSFWSALQSMGFSSQWLRSLWSTGSRATGFGSLWVCGA